MALFGKSKSKGRGDDDAAADAARETERAKAVAKRGVAARGTVEAMAATGRTRHEGVGREIAFTIRLDTPAGAVQVVTRQFMNELTLTGLAPGEPVSVLYDRDDPQCLVVMQSPRYVFVHNPNQAFDGVPMIAVPTAQAGPQEG
jgi:hypothetical protein